MPFYYGGIAMRPMKLCHFPGCRTLIDGSEMYCNKHSKEVISRQQLAAHEINAARYHKRMYDSDESKYQQFYHSTAWRKASKLWLESHPVCVECLKQGVIKQGRIVDHVIPLRKAWDKRLDTGNLQTLCIMHHNRKSAKEKAERKK